MVQKLTQNRISFQLPLLSKSLGFFSTANRTISLFSVFSVKRMTVLAKFLGSIYSSNGFRIFKSILLSSNASKMFRIYTRPISTNMVYDHAYRDISIFEIVSNSMSTAKFPLIIKRAISISIKMILPNKTIINNFIKRLEPCYVLFHVIHYTPLISRKQYV